MIKINEWRLIAEDFKLAGAPMIIQVAQMNEILDRLERAEKERDDANAAADAALVVLENRQARIDRLVKALSELLNDLEERAKWNLDENQRVVACGNGVYVRAKVALEEAK